MKDGLGDRMKDHEGRTRFFLPKRIFGLLRVDGKAFHTYTKGCRKPFDEELMEDMNRTAQYLCDNIQGARFGYVQSDEITIMFTDYFDYKTELWFDGNIQKISSISASLATAKFNQLRTERLLSKSWNSYVYGRGQEDEPFFLNWDFTASLGNVKLAQFDSRVWSLSLINEAMNTFIWRQKDAVRNSIQMVAQSLYSQKELSGKNGNQQQELIYQKGINWNDFPAGQKRGRMIVKRQEMVESTTQAFLKANEEQKQQFITRGEKIYIVRDKWVIDDAFDFTKDQERLELIFKLGKEFKIEELGEAIHSNTRTS
jgi:tRNA(His) 5'-end guanylyltransferase